MTVVKIGGALLGTDLSGFWQQVAALEGQVVIVHGGGPQSTDMARRLGHEPRMVRGRRVTSDLDLSIVKWVLRGELSTDLVRSALQASVRAVGISGADGGLVRVDRRPPWTVDGEDVDFGWVGDVTSVDARLVGDLLAAGWVPIVTPMGTDASGQVYNVNADTIALELAAALKADTFLLATEVGGVLGADGQRIGRLPGAVADAGVRDGWIAGGMQVKVHVARQALARGVGAAWIVAADDLVHRQRATQVEA